MARYRRKAGIVHAEQVVIDTPLTRPLRKQDSVKRVAVAGEWIITRESGHQEIVSNADFTAQFELDDLRDRIGALETAKTPGLLSRLTRGRFGT